MSHLYRTIISLCWLLTGMGAITAQPIQATAQLDTQELRIGEPLHYTLTVKHQTNLRVTWPAWVDTLGSFEVIDTPAIDSTVQAGEIIQRQTLTLMAFDSGTYRIPPLRIDYLRPGQGDVRHVETEGFQVPVYTIPVDTTADIRNIKDIQEDPMTLEEILINLGVGLGILAVLGLIIWLVIRYQRKEPIIPPRPRPQVPAHERAMRELGELESQRLWQSGDIKSYYAEISTILRRYIENRYQIPALESVTDEITRDLRSLNVPEKQLKTLTELLQAADLAKFAKSQPTEKDNLQAIETAREFIRSTKLVKSESTDQVVESTPPPTINR